MPLMIRAPLARLGLLVTAVLQLLLPAFASVVDGQAEARSERFATVHIESHGTPSCVPIHAADCAVCRVIAGGATVAHATAVLAPVRIVAAALPQHATVAVSATAPDDASQRAPPIV